MRSGPSVAVVILNFNGLAHLQQFIPLLVQHTPTWARILVADNASTDSSLIWLRQHFPAIELIELKENNGYAGGYNLALKQVEADVLVLLNSDVAVTDNWLAPVVNWLWENESHAAAMPKIRSYAAPDHFEYAGACGGYMDGLCIPFCRGRVMETVEKDDGQYDAPAKVFWATGAALFVRAKAFWEVGGFDAHFFAHMEEVDLCWRLQLQGYSVGVVPQAVVYHVGGGTLPKGERKLMLNLRNSLWMMARNLPRRQAAPMILLRMCIDWAYAAKELLSGNSTVLRAVRKAHIAFLRKPQPPTMPATAQRKSLWQLQGVHKTWIPVAYQILGRKTFRQITGKMG